MSLNHWLLVKSQPTSLSNSISPGLFTWWILFSLSPSSSFTLGKEVSLWFTDVQPSHWGNTVHQSCPVKAFVAVGLWGRWALSSSWLSGLPWGLCWAAGIGRTVAVALLSRLPASYRIPYIPSPQHCLSCAVFQWGTCKYWGECLSPVLCQDLGLHFCSFHKGQEVVLLGEQVA